MELPLVVAAAIVLGQPSSGTLLKPEIVYAWDFVRLAAAVDKGELHGPGGNFSGSEDEDEDEDEDEGED